MIILMIIIIIILICIRFKNDAYEVRFKFISEHSIDGKFYDGEMQIYHKEESGSISVVCVFLQIDNKQYENGDKYINEFLLEIWPERF